MTNEEDLLMDAATAAYELARSEVFNVGLKEDSPTLTPRQREVLVGLASAELELREFRGPTRAAP